MVHAAKLRLASETVVLLLTVSVACISCRSAAAQSETHTVDEIAAEVSKAILDSSGPVNGMPIVSLNGLAQLRDTPEDLVLTSGLERDFQQALIRNAKGLEVLEEGSADAARLQITPKRTTSEDAEAVCLTKGPSRGQNFEINGFVEQRGDVAMLWIKVTRLVKVKLVFDRQSLVTITPALRAIAAQAIAEERIAFDKAKDVIWTRPGFELPTDAWDMPSEEGRKRYQNYTWPQIIRGDRARYPATAAREKTQGTVNLKVLVDAEGHPAAIILLRGIPCDFGLNQAAIDATTLWITTPAKDPSGSAVPSWIEIEQSFALY